MKRLFLLLFVVLAMAATAAAQQVGSVRTIHGIVVTANDNEPVIGAAVKVDGTDLSGMTDVDGKFTIKNVPASAKTIYVSYVGLSSEHVPITDGEIKVSLGLSAEMLDDVGGDRPWHQPL